MRQSVLAVAAFLWLLLPAGCDQEQAPASASVDPPAGDPSSGVVTGREAGSTEPGATAATDEAEVETAAETPTAGETTPAPPEPPPPPPPPPGPWDEADCLPSDVDKPFTVLCRDREAARAYALEHGQALPAMPRSHGELRDPMKPTDGLPLHRSVRRRIAPWAKFTPILFFETPPFSAAQWRFFEENRDHWKTARNYWSKPRKQVREYKRLRRRLRDGDKETLRKLILRNGYLYTEDRRLGRRIYKTVRLQHLFDEETIWLQRGDEVYELRRHKRSRRGYEHVDGPMKGRRAVILLFDRVATSPDAFADTFHWDLQAVRHGLGLYTIDIDETKARTLDFASTFLSGEPIEGVLFQKDGRTAVAVAGFTPDAWAAVHTDNRRRFRARERILDAAEAFADEWIRFDEPDIEFGQEDGILRDAWTEAYLEGEDRYEVNGVEYRVFGGGGTPIPPQVCVDFLMDAIERASGTWWREKTRNKRDRERLKGTIDWNDFRGLARRSIAHVSRFAKDNPEMFEVYQAPKRLQVKFEEKQAFYRNLENFPVDFREADMIFIWGYREDEKRHYHSFFVHMIDPIDGFPIILSDNAGLAAVRVWYDVMKTAPRRYVYRRVRLKDDWLLERGLGDM